MIIFPSERKIISLFDLDLAIQINKFVIYWWLMKLIGILLTDSVGISQATLLVGQSHHLLGS